MKVSLFHFAFHLQIFAGGYVPFYFCWLFGNLFLHFPLCFDICFPFYSFFHYFSFLILYIFRETLEDVRKISVSIGSSSGNKKNNNNNNADQVSRAPSRNQSLPSLPQENGNNIPSHVTIMSLFHLFVQSILESSKSFVKIFCFW
jgi:hypothetical protein